VRRTLVRTATGTAKTSDDGTSQRTKAEKRLSVKASAVGTSARLLIRAVMGFPLRASSRRRSGSQRPIGNYARRSRGRRPHVASGSAASTNAP
jgi:hypothetical protein